MELKNIFDEWAKSTRKKYADKQWLLSKWEVVEGIEWPQKKIDLMMESILQGLQLEATDSLIDLGCGGGWITAALKPHCQSIIGFDISYQMLKNARMTLKSKKFVCGEIGKIPIKDNTFTRALSYFVFMNFSDDAYIETAILEILRVLKSGGRALIGQLPDETRSAWYDKAKAEYVAWCLERFPMGKNNRDTLTPPIKLFNRDRLISFLRKHNIAFYILDSFNPFYREGQAERIAWRFDLILSKS